MENNNQKSNRATLWREIAKKIEWARDYMEIKFWSTWLRILLSFSVWYILTIQFIAPLFKEVFLIASWTNIMFIFLIAGFIWMMISIFYSFMVKILLYIFN